VDHLPHHLFLFDVDSVLVEAVGYLKALQGTVAHFTEQLGAGSHPPTETEARTFEAHGLTSEWDSGAACVGLVLIERLLREPELCPPGCWSEALDYLSQRPCPLPHPDYLDLAAWVGSRLDASTTPARVATEYLEERFVTGGGQEGRHAMLSLLLSELLGHTHDFYRAPVTRYLQHLVIGSKRVPATYGVEADFESPSYLMRHDRSFLAPSWRARVRRCIAGGHAGAAIYTARPSLPPAELEESKLGFSPEAEAARALVGLDGLPLIGEGKMRWLAAQSGEEVERLVKPSPVQALAAIGAASSGREASALQAALALHCDGKLEPPLARLEAITVHVFEDTVGGLVAVERAVDALRAAGLAVDYHPYGIVVDGPKVAAMSGRQTPTYSSVGEALAVALKRVELSPSAAGREPLGDSGGGT